MDHIALQLNREEVKNGERGGGGRLFVGGDK